MFLDKLAQAISTEASLLVAQYPGERAGGEASARARHYRHAVSAFVLKELGEDLSVTTPVLEEPAVPLKKTDELEACYGR